MNKKIFDHRQEGWSQSKSAAKLVFRTLLRDRQTGLSLHLQPWWTAGRHQVQIAVCYYIQCPCTASRLISIIMAVINWGCISPRLYQCACTSTSVPAPPPVCLHQIKTTRALVRMDSKESRVLNFDPLPTMNCLVIVSMHLGSLID